ncbi:uncharacterized protein N7443_000244 [Penicillium atrosanguineum]|uniref:uncharacterized protein n=1 Tax=Penicillium atrosanguineum TaxID=1132637 RepID=UPI002389C228|nr:uncharacterized protein N7443_000244 [Penicillium atrosanguineum]KAJ5313360.1 hypothetical protein N7443_000244 [Penicillium atrosanguineum]
MTNILGRSLYEKYPRPRPIKHFDSVLGLSGIAEGAHGVFYVAGANTTLDNISDPPTNATHIWEVDFTKNSHHPHAKLLCRPGAPTEFNGMAASNETIVLASASYQDSIFAIDTKIGYTWEAMKQTSLMSNINSIKVSDGYLIFQGSACDDFAISPKGFTLNSTFGSDIEQVTFTKNGTAVGHEIIAGAEDPTEVVEPTGVFFGRDEGELNKIYVTTGSARAANVDVNGTDVAVGAQLLEIRLS